MESTEEFPTMTTSSSRGHTFEASASTIWTLLFLAYSSNTFVSEFGQGWKASWTIGLVILPVILAGLPNVMDGRKHALPILLSYIAYAIIPGVLQLLKPHDYSSRQSELFDVITVAVIWLPLEFKLLSRRLSATGKVTAWGSLTAALNIINTFTILRPFTKVEHAHGLGYTYKLTTYDVITSVLFAGICIAIVLPIASVIKFAKIRRRPTLQQKPNRELAVFIGLYMSAVTEELLFRGLIHNMIQQRFSDRSLLPLIFSSLAYAVAHVSKTKLGFEPPNVRFGVCAFIGGLVYGIVWQLTSKVTAAAVTHAIADFVLYRTLLGEFAQS